ncbi:sensor histidine kinase [Caldimonas tepidiphila]|uniref:sensor histidine kinase n=1 Tax=Caldimonas tepidiphila TaxID=2315841 RepID=UPI000E5C48DB|nr:sensor histidine kinase [Caldimonas tepidiphila]
MRWRRPERGGAASLRRTLLLLLIPTVALVTVAELWMTQRQALAAANAAYDRSLLGAIRSIDANVSTATGGLSVELPYRLFEFFQLTADGRVFFRVATADRLVEVGNADLPLPPRPLELEQPVFYDTVYFGEPLRVGAYLRELDRPLTRSEAEHLVIQVAETTESRARFTREFVLRAALRDALLLAMMALAVAAVVALALRPVSRLAAQVRERAASDLTPLAAGDLPAEIEPLVAAVNQQMARSQQLAGQQRQFLDDASHQLRTPLATLRTQVDYALREADPEARRQTLEAVSQQIDHAIRATNQLLALARSDTAAVRVEPFELGALLREVAVDLLPRARARRIDLGIDEPPRPLPVEGDRGLLREALANLVDNAIRYVPEGGVVTLSAAADALGASATVEDDGPGVPDEERDLLGQRFVRGRGSVAGGSGLGLAIARSIAERHGGVLRLERASDAGGLRAALWWPRRGDAANGSLKAD